MKRLVLLVVLSLLVLGVVAVPALAWYDIKPHTAYVTPGFKGWGEWVGPGPFDTKEHTGAITHGYKVVVGYTWIDSEMGARLAPAVFLNTFALHKVGGSWALRQKDPGKSAKFWSPVYEWDTTGSPGIWGADWWVPLGKLTTGTYTGWVRERTLSSYPTWTDENGKLLTDPVWSDKVDETYKVTFRVK